MKPRCDEAMRLESDYLVRVKAELSGRPANEIDEIIESLREHIEEALSELPGDEVSLVTMANVLEKLGPPDSYREEPGQSAAAAPVPTPAPRMRELPPSPTSVHPEPATLSAATIINIGLLLVSEAVSLAIVPKFHKIFKQFGGDLPVLTQLFVNIPNWVYVIVVPLGVFVLVGKDLLIRNRVARGSINAISMAFLLLYPALLTISMYLPLLGMMTGTSE